MQASLTMARAVESMRTWRGSNQSNNVSNVGKTGIVDVFHRTTHIKWSHSNYYYS